MPGFDLSWRQISKQQDGLSPSRNPSAPLQDDGYRFALPILRAIAARTRQTDDRRRRLPWRFRLPYAGVELWEFPQFAPKKRCPLFFANSALPGKTENKGRDLDFSAFSYCGR